MNNDIITISGEGYNLTVTPEAELRKADLLSAASGVLSVTDNEQSFLAQHQVRNLAALRIEVERSRKLVKEPVNRIGKLIDETAKNFIGSVIEEEERIKALVGSHAAQVEMERRKREAEESKAFEAARAAREAAEIVGDESIATDALAERLAASEALAATQIAKGVSFTWDFEVTDARQLFNILPELVDLAPKRSAILDWLKTMESKGQNVVGAAATVGITAFKKTKVSTR